MPNKKKIFQFLEILKFSNFGFPMKLSDFFSCCFSEDPVPEKKNLLIVFTEKSLTHSQICVIHEKATVTNICETIVKTEQILKAKFGHSKNNYALLPGKGKMKLMLLCRDNYTRFSTRILNFFEYPLNFLKFKPLGSECKFLVMRESEIQAFQEVKKRIKYDFSQFSNILEKGIS